MLERVLLPFAKRFVAGTDRDAALDRTRELNRDGITALIDELGEHVEQPAVAAAARDAYVDLIERIDAEDLDAHLSVKPTHLGLGFSEHAARNHIADLVETGAEHGVFVWIDMESSEFTDATLRIHDDIQAEYDNLGVCIQAYLKRSLADVEALVDRGAHVRLVKGAYSEEPSIAYQDRDRVRDQFRAILRELAAGDDWFAVGTHDEVLIDEARELLDEHGRDDCMFQFLMGVKEDVQREMAAEGVRVGQYVPYGPDWPAYYWRRVRERRENLFFALRAIFSR